MRLALGAAIQHARHRTVFQRRLIDQPLMTRVLADLAVEWEAAARLSLRLARSFDEATGKGGGAWRRVMTPVTKYWVCKSVPAFVYEAMECMGGNGYVEEGLFARLYREAPLNAIWEGSGNVMALDLLRALQREREAAEAVLADLAQSAAGDVRLKGLMRSTMALLAEPAGLEANGRALIEGLAVLAAAAVLLEEAPGEVGDAFISTHCGDRVHRQFGTATPPAKARGIVDRAFQG